MNDETFWALIATLDWEEQGDDQAVLEPLVEALKALDESEITAFDDALAAKLYALDTRAFGDVYMAAHDGHLSPDDFLYCRACVVANGRKFHDDVLRRPERFPAGMEFESLLFAADTAFAAKTGRAYEHVTKHDYETGSNRDGWA